MKACLSAEGLEGDETLLGLGASVGREVRSLAGESGRKSSALCSAPIARGEAEGGRTEDLDEGNLTRSDE